VCAHRGKKVFGLDGKSSNNCWVLGGGGVESIEKGGSGGIGGIGGGGRRGSSRQSGQSRAEQCPPGRNSRQRVQPASQPEAAQYQTRACKCAARLR
jgi:hypothetical protein